MKTLKLAWLTVVQLFRQVRQIPQAIAMAGKRRQRQVELGKLEDERRDRILNPWKYRGK